MQGLEQSRHTVLPQVQSHCRSKPFVEDELRVENALGALPGRLF
jgi:hypothetical protein